jgi:hypothetical protein
LEWIENWKNKKQKCRSNERRFIMDFNHYSGVHQLTALWVLMDKQRNTGRELHGINPFVFSFGIS